VSLAKKKKKILKTLVMQDATEQLCTWHAPCSFQWCFIKGHQLKSLCLLSEKIDMLMF